MQQMCETISFYLRWAFGEEIEPEAIFNASPRGELWFVFFLFDDAVKWLLS